MAQYGRVLCAVGPVDGKLNPDGTTNYLTPTYFFEFDPSSSTLTAITNPSNNGQAPFNGRMSLLPTGQVLFANGSTTINVYTPDGAPDPAWKPSIISHPNSLLSNHVYTLTGHQLNGLSQAVSYGDKHEIDVVVKNAIENKNKDDETGLGQLFGEDPEWMKAIRMLAERSDRIEELLVQQRAFIREEDRPVLGEQALLISETEMLVEMEAKPSVKAEVKTDGDGKE